MPLRASSRGTKWRDCWPACPPQQKAVVVLRYLLDEPDEQIAQALGCTQGTVRSHLSHARTALRLTAAAGADKE